MAIEKREQVFISSTFRDLVDERRAVIQTLLEADCIPAGMELFPASDDEKWALIQRVIDLCDYYVVIVGGRYGSLDAQEQLSYTEMEFDYAVQQKKPVMGFLHGDPGKLIGDKIDLDGEQRARLEFFRAKIEAKMVKYWNTPADLPGQVALAIMQIRKSHPVEGWIRAGDAMTPEIKAELAELRAKVRELTADLKDEQRQHTDAADTAELLQGDDTARLDCTIEFHWQSDLDGGNAHRANRSTATWTVEPTWNQLLRHLGPELMDEASEDYLKERLSALCLQLAYSDLVEEDDDEDEEDEDSAASTDESNVADAEPSRKVGNVYEATVTIESFNDVKVQFSALGLIERGTRRRPGSDTNTYWLLTNRGHQQLLRLRPVRRPTPDMPQPTTT
ncbi:MAG: DUF4062 domain-containing protein [Ilumatobacteraceae bacterium]